MVGELRPAAGCADLSADHARVMRVTDRTCGRGRPLSHQRRRRNLLLLDAVRVLFERAERPVEEDRHGRRDHKLCGTVCPGPRGPSE